MAKPIDQCGDKCLSVRFANDSGRAAAIDAPAPVLCGFGCGAYGEAARGGMCASCIRSKGFEKDFPAAADSSLAAQDAVLRANVTTGNPIHQAAVVGLARASTGGAAGSVASLAAESSIASPAWLGVNVS